MRRISPASLVILGGLSALAASCSSDPTKLEGVSTFRVTITSVNGSSTLPTIDAPLPANRGDTEETWDFTIEARTAFGEPDPFSGMVRLNVEPGAVNSVIGDGAQGRNILLKN